MSVGTSLFFIYTKYFTLSKDVLKEQMLFVYNSFDILLRDDFDLKRIASTYLALLKMGVKIKKDRKEELFRLIKRNQFEDGGFTELRETLIVLEILYQEGKSISDILDWVYHQVDESGGIRAHERERTRMPDTSLAFSLLKKLHIENPHENKMIHYINDTWRKELYEQGGLTYKAGRFLSAYSKYPKDIRNLQISLYNDTINFLEKNQHEDGGFSPNIHDELPSMPTYSSIVYKGVRDVQVFDDSEKVTIMCSKLLEYLINSSQAGCGWPEHERDYTTSIIVYNLIDGGK